MKRPLRFRGSFTCACLTALFVAPALSAGVVPAPLFTDHAVLQRDKPIPVWGSARPGERVAVTFAGHTAQTTTDASGRWRVELPALPATSTPSDLVIKGDNTIVLSDIVVGEVWLASGQSNMEFVVNQSYDAAIDVAASANFPLIRHIKIARRIADEPLATSTETATPTATTTATTTAASEWQVAGPATTGGFSAVGYYFALDVHQLLQVPVGIVHSSVGGSPIEAWLDSAAFKIVPKEAAKIHERWGKALANYPAAKTRYDAALVEWSEEQAAAKAAGRSFSKRRPDAPLGPGHHYTPSGLNNGMIAPLVPYALRGVVWYQGEANADQAADYRALFSAMIAGWRAQFGQGDIPFYWVQLSSYQSRNAADTTWAFLREAQTQTLALPNTGQAVSIDIGRLQDAHPRNKRDVGRRLARLALARTYGHPIIDSGPVFARADREGAGFRVSFTETHGGLLAPQPTLGGFELAGPDQVFKSATAKIENNTVFVTSPDVPEPAAVRYAWRNATPAGLFNGEGLPAVPFRSDAW